MPLQNTEANWKNLTFYGRPSSVSALLFKLILTNNFLSKKHFLNSWLLGVVLVILIFALEI